MNNRHPYSAVADSNKEPVKATENVYAKQLKEYQDQIEEYRKVVTNIKVSGPERQEARNAIAILKKKILDLPAGEVTTNEVKSSTIADKQYTKTFRLKNNHYIL